MSVASRREAAADTTWCDRARLRPRWERRGRTVVLRGGIRSSKNEDRKRPAAPRRASHAGLHLEVKRLLPTSGAVDVSASAGGSERIPIVKEELKVGKLRRNSAITCVSIHRAEADRDVFP